MLTISQDIPLLHNSGLQRHFIERIKSPPGTVIMLLFASLELHTSGLFTPTQTVLQMCEDNYHVLHLLFFCRLYLPIFFFQPCLLGLTTSWSSWIVNVPFKIFNTIRIVDTIPNATESFCDCCFLSNEILV